MIVNARDSWWVLNRKNPQTNHFLTSAINQPTLRMNSLCSHIKGQRCQWPAFCILQGLAVAPSWNLGCSAPGVGSPAVGSAPYSSSRVSLLGAAGRRSWGETCSLEREVIECQSDRPTGSQGTKPWKELLRFNCANPRGWWEGHGRGSQGLLSPFFPFFPLSHFFPLTDGIKGTAASVCRGLGTFLGFSV